MRKLEKWAFVQMVDIAMFGEQMHKVIDEMGDENLEIEVQYRPHGIYLSAFITGYLTK